MIEAMLFDMDGLLLDTERVHLDSYAALCAQLGHRVPAQHFIDAIGLADDVVIPRLAARVGYSGSIAALTARREELYRGAIGAGPAPLMPGVPEAFRAGSARGLRRGLVSSSPPQIVEPSMAALARQLGHRGDWRTLFDAVTTGDEAPTKPAPDLYLRTCAKLSLAPASCLAFEDSPAGVRAAVAAGCRAVAIPHPHVDRGDPAFAEAHCCFGSLVDALAHPEILFD